MDDSDNLEHSGVLLIADQEKPLAIAGVMGGLQSAVGVETTDILFESAFFEPQYIAGVARAHGLCTDASQRFERGVDPALHREMIERATALLLDIAGGKPGPVVWMHAPDLFKTKIISFDPARVLTLTGLHVPVLQIETFLTALGMVVVRYQALWQITVPSYRFDIATEVDLVEEIARLYGYDALTPVPTFAKIRRGTVSPAYEMTRQVGALLHRRGYHEIVSYSFVDPSLQAAFFPDTEKLKLLNPLSSELSEMRVSLWSGLMAALIHNLSRQQTMLRFFETGVVFEMQAGVLSERLSTAGLLMGEVGGLNWSQQKHQYDFYDIKGDVEALFSSFNQSVRFVPESLPALHPGKSARIYLGEQAVGWIGVLHPALAESFDLTEEVILFEIALAPLVHTKPVQYQKISKYPQVRRDLSLLIDKAVHADEVEVVVRSVIQALPYHANRLKAFYIFDKYMGEQVPVGKKSLAIALIFQDEQRTLTEEDIKQAVEAVITGLSAQLSAEVRDGA